jgi:hypothetical protein
MEAFTRPESSVRFRADDGQQYEYQVRDDRIAHFVGKEVKVVYALTDSLREY